MEKKKEPWILKRGLLHYSLFTQLLFPLASCRKSRASLLLTDAGLSRIPCIFRHKVYSENQCCAPQMHCSSNSAGGDYSLFPDGLKLHSIHDTSELQPVEIWGSSTRLLERWWRRMYKPHTFFSEASGNLNLTSHGRFRRDKCGYITHLKSICRPCQWCL